MVGQIFHQNLTTDGLTDPDPALFTSDLQDANKKYFCLLNFEGAVITYFKDKNVIKKSILVPLANRSEMAQKTYCAAKAFCDCPAIISHRPGSQNILKEAQLNPEKDSRIKRARSHVSLEKSSQNYKPMEK